MIVSKLASACFNEIQGGLAGYGATLNMSLQLLEDEIVEERLSVIKEYSLKNLIPVKDLAYSLNCLEVDCKSLDKCCDSGFSDPIAHIEIPQIVNDFGDEAILYLGTVNKEILFKVYTSPVALKYQKYKLYRSKRPYAYIDTTPNEHNAYDCFLFNVPLLEKVSIIAVFKDPRLVAEYACCNLQDADNLSFVATEVKKRVIEKKLRYYRLLYPQPMPNNQVPA